MAGVSDPDTPTDIGIFKTMYETAYKEKLSMFLMAIHLELKVLNH